jgi:protoporphyrin/coproporphyrin ferrochelatase
MTHTAIILTALGGPGSLDEVGPFMTAFMGRTPPPRVIEAVKERYALIGGKSPLVSIVNDQAAAVEKELGSAFRCYAGFSHSAPAIEASYALAKSRGADRFVFLSMSPFETAVTTGAYKKVLGALDIPASTMTFIPAFHDNPLFIRAWRESIAAALPEPAGSTAVIFTAHSIPVHYIDSGDPYKAQIEETVGLITGSLRLDNWFIAWQSKGARATEPWLEPDVESTMVTLAQSGVSAIVEVPVGFTCDHLETLYDIDIGHRGFAEKLGLSFRRVASLNTNPLFIRALADIIQKGIAS